MPTAVAPLRMVRRSFLGRRFLGAALSPALFCACSGDGPAAGLPQVAWHVPGDGWGVAPSVDDVAVYFGSMNHELVAVGRRSGEILWRATTGADGARTFGTSTVRVADIVAMQDLDLHGFAASDGRRQWTFRPVDGDVTGTRRMARRGDTLYLASEKGRLYAVNGRTGAELWRVQLSADSEMQSYDPSVIGNRVYVALRRLGPPASGGIVALDAVSGAERWRIMFQPSYEGANHGSLVGAVGYSDLVIASSDDGTITAYDTTSREVRWTAPRVHPILPDPEGTRGDIRILVNAGDVILAGSYTGILVALDATTGIERWRTQLDVSISYPPAVEGDTAYVAQIGGIVAAVDIRTGAVLWKTGRTSQSGRSYFGPGVARDGRLYIAAEDGFLSLRVRAD